MVNGKRIGAVVPAAGKGKRMGGDIAKQFLMLKGKPIFIHTLEGLSAMQEVDIIIVAAAHGEMEAVQKYIAEYRISKVSAVVEGGDERQDSVWNCLQKMNTENVDIVVVHDAVRPLFTRDLVLSVCHAAVEAGAAIPVVSPKDTVKIINNEGYVASTMERASLAIVQTPQAFKFSLIYQAYEKAMNERFYGTDDACLVERLGMKVKVVEGSYRNIKITTEDDIGLAQGFLA